MNLNIFKKAFSLTELLIVLVVVAVLFAAMAPIMTKRRSGSTVGFEPVWQFVNDDQRDAFYDKGVPGWTTSAHIGLSPSVLKTVSDRQPYAKVVLRANPDQDMIQFRYGPTNGSFAAILSMGEHHSNYKDNLLTISKPEAGTNHTKPDSVSNFIGNTAYGNGSFLGVGAGQYITSIGSNSTMRGYKTGASGSTSYTAYNNTTAIGASANQYGEASDSVLLGANAGRTEEGRIKKSVAIGVNSLSIPKDAAASGGDTAVQASMAMDYNVFAGYQTAGVGAYGVSNTLAGSRFRGQYIDNSRNANYNTLIGQGAYEDESINPTSYKMTAVGWGACNSFKTGSDPASLKTCIGYTSGGNPNGTAGLNWDKTAVEHIFLGGVPVSGQLGGRSVLEVHNFGLDDLAFGATRSNMIKTGPTVVMNSNLVVRGNLYFPDVVNNELMAHTSGFTVVSEKNPEYANDHCGKCCSFRRKWRNCSGCNVFTILLTALSFIAYIVGGILSCTPAAVAGWAGVGLGMVLMALNDRSKGATRPADAPTGSYMQFYNDSTVCAGSFTNYPTKCVDLKLSDARLKENITENKDAISKLLLIQPYDYSYKADKDATPHVGVIAQDLQVYFPQSVNKSVDGYMNIRWDEMFFATINSVKSLDEVLTDLEKDANELEKDTVKLANNHKVAKERIKDLDKRLKNLEK